jgi:hypothetical protein
VEELLDFGSEITDDQKQYLTELLERTTFDEEVKQFYRMNIAEMEKIQQFELMLGVFKMNEIQDKDRIAYGMPYNQSDIKKTLKAKQ